MPPIITVRFRCDTPQEWAKFNPTLMHGEIGLTLPEGNFKVGDGKTPWSELAFSTHLPIEARVMNAGLRPLWPWSRLLDMLPKS